MQPSTRQDQNVAIGFNGDPVPPFTGIGAALTRNIQRFRFWNEIPAWKLVPRGTPWSQLLFPKHTPEFRTQVQSLLGILEDVNAAKNVQSSAGIPVST